MKTPETPKDLEDLIQNKTEENFSLEYKEARALADPKEIAKDISAMANSAGGIVIYGISEKDKKFPERITPINENEFSKESLDQIISSNISPKIEGLKIIPPIKVSGGFVYVVEVPQSTTVHQNTKDFKYYKRRNFISEPMLDYEIRDVLNRIKHPIINLELEIEVVNNEKYPNSKNGDYLTYRIETDFFLKIRPCNKGSVYAQFVNYFIEIPSDILPKDFSQNLKKISSDEIEYYGENLLKDSINSPSRFDPILPSLHGRSEKIPLKKDDLDMRQILSRETREIKWRVHADNAPVQFGSILLSQIPFKKNVS